MEVFSTIVVICSGLLTITNLVVLLKTKAIGVRNLREGQKCLLRSEILRIYYKYSVECEIPQHLRQNVDYLYEAYKSLGGNSFISDVYEEIREWKITK